MKNSKKTILIAESSKVLGKIIQNHLENAGFKTILFHDGFEALKETVAQKPDCVISDKYLPSIDGMQFCSVIKKAFEFNEIPFILFSAEEEVADFWTSSTGANKLVSLSSNNIEDLEKAINDILFETDNNKIEIKTFIENEIEVVEEKNLSICTIKAMEQSNSYYNLLKKVIELTQFVEDLDELIEHLFLLLYEITTFSAAAIILKDSTHHIYLTGTEYLDEESTDTFLKICKKDYEEQLKSNTSVVYDTFTMEGLTFQMEMNKKFASYSMFPIGLESFVGTIHFASEKKRFFTYKSQSTVQFLTNSINHILNEAIMRRKIAISESKLRSTFSKFVPEEIIEDLLNQEDTTNETSNNEKRIVAVLISDIRNFTSISEINKPENVVGFLNKYFSTMVDIIKKHGGSIDKFIGDAIMALFGAPISYVDNAQRAVEAAQEMVKALEDLDTSILDFPEGMSFDIGIGIHYGEVIVGNIGSKEKTNYTVIGDSVNLTSRLEGLTKQYGARIIISQETQTELSESIPTMLLDKVRVKGKKQGVQVYRVDNKPLPKDYVETYEKGLNLYMNGAWTLALSYFEKALELSPENKAAKLMKQRCEDFIENPPEDWNGSVALTSK